MVIRCLLVRANITSGKREAGPAKTPSTQAIKEQASAVGVVPGVNNVHALDPSTHDPNNVFLTWEKEPQNILVVKKPGGEVPLVETFANVCAYLLEQCQRVVYVEDPLLQHKKDEGKIMKQDATFQRIVKQLKKFKPNNEDCNECINFIVCVGGDGTLIHVSRLFQKCMPPVIAFAAGSLGFLTPFPLESYDTAINTALKGDCHLVLRSRIKCFICKRDSMCSRASHARNIDPDDSSFQYNALNEVVVQRKGPYLSALDIYVDGKFVTCMQGDGLIVSTTTGSTAYSLAAGASMVHPSVPALLLTPICAHSLSFRPVVMPAGCDITLMLADDARDGAVVTVDGRLQRELEQGDSLRVTTSLYPLPSVCRKDPVTDWFDSLKVGLNWNQRPLQKPFESSLNVASSHGSSVNLHGSTNSLHNNSSSSSNNNNNNGAGNGGAGSFKRVDSVESELVKMRSSSSASGSINNSTNTINSTISMPVTAAAAAAVPPQQQQPHDAAVSRPATSKRTTGANGVAVYHRGSGSSNLEKSIEAAEHQQRNESDNNLPQKKCPKNYTLVQKENKHEFQPHQQQQQQNNKHTTQAISRHQRRSDPMFLTNDNDSDDTATNNVAERLQHVHVGDIRRGMPPGSGVGGNLDHTPTHSTTINSMTTTTAAAAPLTAIKRDPH